MFIHEKIKDAREGKGMTQTDMVFELDKLGLRISRQTLVNWETGESTPNGDDIAILAKFFNKNEQYFFAKKSQFSTTLK